MWGGGEGRGSPTPPLRLVGERGCEAPARRVTGAFEGERTSWSSGHSQGKSLPPQHVGSSKVLRCCVKEGCWEEISFFFLFFFFLGLHLEVPRLGVDLELQLLAHTPATAMPDLSGICDLHQSLWQR